MNEFRKIIEDFQNNEVSAYGNLPYSTRLLISLAVQAALGTARTIPEEVTKALVNGIPPEAIAEAIIQSTPYIGCTKSLEALEQAENAMKMQNIEFPLKNCATVTQQTRLEKGLAAQYAIFGRENIDRNRQSAPPELRHIQEYLSDYCFGDFYTRSGLDLKTRELLTFCILCALGGCEPQLKAHIGGNLRIGNDRETLLSAVTWCIPYIGFPRTLNAIACINEVVQA